MAYVDSVLTDDEAVRITARLTPFFWPGVVLSTILVLMLSILNAWCLVGLTLPIWLWANMRLTQISVTNRRVLLRSGVIFRRIDEMPLAKVESVQVEQGPVARLLNYGDIKIGGTGGQFLRVNAIHSPFLVRDALQRQD